MHVRKAERVDVDGIVAIGRQTWPLTYSFAGAEYIEDGLARWWSAEAIEQSLHDTTVLVAGDDDGLRGMGNIDLRGEFPIIWKLYVLPDAQGTGVGSQLMAALLDRAPGRPVRLRYVDGNDRAARFTFDEASRSCAESRPTVQAGLTASGWSIGPSDHTRSP